MPRKTQNKYMQYDRTNMSEVVGKIKAGTISIKKASQIYLIPYSTLRDRVSGRIEIEAQPGASSVLTVDEETRLSNYLIKLAELGVGKSRDQVKEMAYMIIHRDPTRSHHCERWLTKQKAGKDWYYGFMKRNKQLSLRTPEKLSKSRPILRENNQDRDPNFIWNCDECGVPLDFRPKEGCYLSRKASNVWSLNSGDKTNITVMGCGSASGKMMPPLVIYKGVRTNKFLVEGAPEGWMVKFSKSGWINSILFEQWFEHHFVHVHQPACSRASQDVKVILLLDGHKSHETLYTLDIARQHNVEIVCLPPNTTHALQPLDVSFFKSLKARWDQVNEDFCRSNHGQFVTKASFAHVFKKAWDICTANKGTIQNGFIRIGISPFQ
ncbi:uncharacterized protein [Amphiura filiformis]|uniref:uncharacterized protein n=1 Tax=Amphiura filiformis TaxID=82378 RepID=UPI003B2138F8